MHSLATDTFSLPELAAASNTKTETIKSYIHKGFVIGIEATGRGKPRKYTWGDVAAFSVAKALTDLGMDSERAFKAVTEYAYTGEGGGGWANDDGSPCRHPGFPYHHNEGTTYLLFDGERCAVQLDTKPMIGGATGHIVIDCTEVFIQTCARIGEDHPFKILDAMYPEAEND